MTESLTTHRRLAHLITSGAYVVGKLPSERDLSASLGVSRNTVRKALAQLADEGVLARAPRRRVQIARGRDGGARRIAFIAPAFASVGPARHEDSLRRVLADRHPDVHLASLRYRSTEEPLFREAARGFDGVFLLLGSEGPDERLRQALIGPDLAPVMGLVQDLSAWGVPFIDLFPPVCVHVMLDRMHALGHRRIGCLNTQPIDPIIAGFARAWQVWMAAHGYSGPMVSEPVRPFEDPTPKAHALMRAALAQHDEVTAWLCLTPEVVRGAIRAVHDTGMVAGREIAVCGIDGQGLEDYLVPSLACIATPDPAPYFAMGLEWMLAGPQRVWHGPLRISPIENTFHPGESLGPVHRPASALTEVLV